MEKLSQITFTAAEQETMTQRVARHILPSQQVSLLPEALTVAKHCVLDWLRSLWPRVVNPLPVFCENRSGTRARYQSLERFPVARQAMQFS